MKQSVVELRKTLLTAASDDIFIDELQENEKSHPEDHFFIDPKLLNRLFSPQNYKVKERLEMLHRMGGISHVLDGLRVWHEDGLQYSEISQQRRKKYGVNCQNAHALKQVLGIVGMELRNPLIQYLLIMQFTILVLEQTTQRDPQPLNILMGIALIFLLVVVRSLIDRLVETQMYKRLKQNDDNTVVVRRAGQQQEIKETEILVGDIMLLNRSNFESYIDDIVTVDGILLQNTPEFKVNENFTIMTDDEVVKNNAWENSLNSDPFILAGSEVISGSGDMLVCTVGENCSFRVVTKLSGYRDSKSKFLSKLINNLHRFNRITKNLLILIVLIEVTSLMIKFSPLEWADVRIILSSVSQSVGMLALVDRQNISDFIYCFVENNCIVNTFKIIRKQAVEEIMAIDILLIEEEMLKIEESYNNRQQRYFYRLVNMEYLQRLASVVDIKILTKKSNSKTKDYKLQQVYNVCNYQMSEKDIRDLKNCKYISDCGVPGLAESIMGTLAIFGYRFGIATVEMEGNLNCLTITSDAARPEVIQNSWVRISSRHFEKGLEDFFLVATRMHLMKGAYSLIIVNNTIILALGYIFLRDLALWQILVVCLLQNITLSNIYKYIGEAQISKIQPTAAIQNDVTFFNITTGVYYLYVFIRLNKAQNHFIFLVINSFIRGVYVLRYGDYMPEERMRFLRKNFFIVFVIILANYLYGVFRPRDEFDVVNGLDSYSSEEEVMLAVMVIFLQLLHFIQKKLMAGLRFFR